MVKCLTCMFNCNQYNGFGYINILQVTIRQPALCESKTRCFFDPQFRLRDSSNFSGKPDLSKHDQVRVNDPIQVTRCQSANGWAKS